MVLVEGKGRKEVVEQPKGERRSKIGNVGDKSSCWYVFFEGSVDDWAYEA